MIVRLIMLIVAGLVIYWPSASRAGEDIKIGSKAFTESVILGEVLAHLALLSLGPSPFGSICGNYGSSPINALSCP